MKEQNAVILMCAGIWLLCLIISFIAARRMKQHRMAVGEEGELIELDEHEDAFTL